MRGIESVKRAAALAAAGVLVAVLGGCGLIATQLATDFSLGVEPEEVTIAPGGSAEVRVSIDRIVPIDVVPVPILVTLHDAPEDVSAEDLELPSGIDADELEIVVDGDAEPRVVELTVRATNGLKTKDSTVLLTIANP